MSELTSVTCANCGKVSEIQRPGPTGRLLWECPSCGERGVDGDGVGEAAVDAEDGLNFVALPEVEPDVTLVVDGDAGTSQDVQA